MILHSESENENHFSCNYTATHLKPRLAVYECL